MKLIRDFLSEIDAGWKPIGGEPICLRLIGSAALMLQTDYERGTKDGDILEAAEITLAVKAQLLKRGGPRTPLSKKFGMYLEVVQRAILFWPQGAVFHPVPDLALKNFSIEVLDVTDIVVSKLKRLNQNDSDDIGAMAAKKLLDHGKLVRRFKSAVDMYSMDARVEDLDKYIANLNRIERDFLGAPESKIEKPDWMQ